MTLGTHGASNIIRLLGSPRCEVNHCSSVNWRLTVCLMKPAINLKAAKAPRPSAKDRDTGVKATTTTTACR